jgi:restriction system protein
MPIPDYQTVMLPILYYLKDGKEHTLREIIDYISDTFKLTAEERKEPLPSGRQVVIDNRVGWAKTYLKKAGLIETPRRSIQKITKRGLEVLNKNPKSINVKYLRQFPEFEEFRTFQREKEASDQEEKEPPTKTARELIEEGYKTIRAELSHDLLEQVKKVQPRIFERIVVDLLLKMGYGGSEKDAGKVIGQSGDEGIDGIIKEDKLGLDVIHVQAKRWENLVGRPVIQTFVGALQGQKARKGILITTSGFTKEAVDYASKIETKVVLIDGPQLAQLMIDFGVGVSEDFTYSLKKVDYDYFLEE